MKGLWAVSLPMIVCRTLCVHIWLCTPGPSDPTGQLGPGRLTIHGTLVY